MATRVDLASDQTTQRSRENLAISEGWKLSGPRPSQFLFPLTSLPKGESTSRSMNSEIPISQYVSFRFFQTEILIRLATNIATMPVSAKRPCLRNRPYGD